MADNVPITPGSGATIATDEVTDGTLGTVQVQFIKLMDGTLNGTNKASVSAANALKVDGSAITQPISAASLPLPTGAATGITQSSANTTQTGTLAIGVVGTSAPSYVSGNLNGLSLNTSGGLRVDGSGVTQPVSGTFWQATQPISGTISATQSGTWTVRAVGNTGNALDFAGQNATGTVNAQLIGGQFNTTPTTVTTGNFSPLQIDASGNLLVNLKSSINLPTVGEVASGSADSGNPQKIGGQARITNPTAVSDGQRVNAIFDKLGKQVVVGAVRDLKKVQKTSITVNTETTVVTAGAAGVFNDVYGIVATNKSATGVSIDFKDATAGTTRMTIYVPATDTRGIMLPVDSAMVQAVAANNWTATVSSAVSSIELTMLYVNNI